MQKQLEEFKSHLEGFFNPKKVEETKEVNEPKVELQEEEVKKTKEVKEEPQVAYVTSEQLSEVKNELLSMIKSLIEENKKEDKEVPAELSKQEEIKAEDVELADVEEIIHTPEVDIKDNSFELRGDSALERIQYALNKQ